MNQRVHPTVRPYALALGVMPRRGIVDGLSFLGPAVAADFASALLLDTLGALSTFPVRHRLVFVDGDDVVTSQIRLPATWRELPQRGGTTTEKVERAFDDLVALGAEAMLLVSADGPMLPLGQMFDGMMWLLPKKRMLVGASEGGGIYALGAAEPMTFLSDVGAALGLGTAAEPGSVDVEDAIAKRAEGAGLECQRLPKSYRIDGLENLKRLRKEVAGGMFAPQCRKLFERPELAAQTS